MKSMSKCFTIPLTLVLLHLPVESSAANRIGRKPPDFTKAVLVETKNIEGNSVLLKRDLEKLAKYLWDSYGYLAPYAAGAVVVATSAWFLSSRRAQAAVPPGGQPGVGNAGAAALRGLTAVGAAVAGTTGSQTAPATPPVTPPATQPSSRMPGTPSPTVAPSNFDTSSQTAPVMPKGDNFFAFDSDEEQEEEQPSKTVTQATTTGGGPSDLIRDTTRANAAFMASLAQAERTDRPVALPNPASEPEAASASSQTKRQPAEAEEEKPDAPPTADAGAVKPIPAVTHAAVMTELLKKAGALKPGAASPQAESKPEPKDDPAPGTVSVDADASSFTGDDEVVMKLLGAEEEEGDDAKWDPPPPAPPQFVDGNAKDASANESPMPQGENEAGEPPAVEPLLAANVGPENQDAPSAIFKRRMAARIITDTLLAEYDTRWRQAFREIALIPQSVFDGKTKKLLKKLLALINNQEIDEKAFAEGVIALAKDMSLSWHQLADIYIHMAELFFASLASNEAVDNTGFLEIVDAHFAKDPKSFEKYRERFEKLGPPN